MDSTSSAARGRSTAIKKPSATPMGRSAARAESVLGGVEKAVVNMPARLVKAPWKQRYWRWWVLDCESYGRVFPACTSTFLSVKNL